MILITGIGGFIANSINDHATGQTVTIGLVDNGRCDFACDLTDDFQVDELIEKLEGNIDAIIHTAGVAPWHGPEVDWDNDIKMAASIVKIAQKHNVPRIVYLSGWVVYEGLTKLPYKISDDVAPVSEYGKSKVAVEKYLRANHKEVYIARLSSVFGPKQVSAGLIPNLIKSSIESNIMHSNARITKRDYIYIDDAASAIVQMASMPHTGVSTFNIGSGTSHAVEEIVALIQNIFHEDFSIDVKAKYDEPSQESDIRDNVQDISQSISFGLLNPSEMTSFKQGLRNVISEALNP